MFVVIAAERIHSSIDRAWSVDEERRYMESLSAREAIHLAVERVRGVVGLQVLDLWSPTLSSMAHVGQLGTFVLPEWRGQGVGRRLFDATLEFARGAAYRKFVIQVRASNTAAQQFYSRLGFRECGRFAQQVIIDGVQDDEVLMELLDLT